MITIGIEAELSLKLGRLGNAESEDVSFDFFLPSETHP